MDPKKVLILSYTHIDPDPRIQRQIAALKENYHIEISGYTYAGDNHIPFYPIYIQPPPSFKRKLKRFIQYVTRNFDKYYWDSGKHRIADLLSKKKYDVIVANDIYTLPLALVIGNKKSKVYFDAHEYHPQEFEDRFKWRWFHKPFIEFLCKTYIPQASAFSTVGYGIANKYKQYIGIEPIVVTNATKYYELEPTTVEPNCIQLVHHGAAIRSRKIELMIEMMNWVDSRFILNLILVGVDSQYIHELKELAKNKKNIRFVQPVKTEQICPLINSFDVGIFLLPPTNFNYLHALPNKLFEFIQARLAIVVTPNPEMSALVTNNQLGIVTDNYTAKSMASSINNLKTEEIAKFKENSHRAAMILNAEENVKKINDIITQLLSS